jgi:hypothetical protein
MDTQCAKCGSEKIIPLVTIIDQGAHSDGRLKAHVGYTNPEAWLFKGAVYAQLQATICGECGHTELLPRTLPPYTRLTSALSRKQRARVNRAQVLDPAGSLSPAPAR